MEGTTGFAPATAIVTGSDSGIGRATAVALARSGLNIGITWHSDQEGAEETADEVRNLGRRGVVRRLDTTDVPGAAAVIDALAEELGGLDVFINNAGTGDGIRSGYRNLDQDPGYEPQRRVRVYAGRCTPHGQSRQGRAHRCGHQCP